jgi:gamma-glutamylcyclotransferase (GGCT)/AIG2-like uncharacterized protein YtfP
MEAQHRLVTYGTLAPGKPNHHHLEQVKGRWLQGYVHGTFSEAGWGAVLGYPALVLDPDGPAVHVHVFESADLPGTWPRLDAFEGPGYRRVVVTVHTAEGELEAQIYALAKPASTDTVAVP